MIRAEVAVAGAGIAGLACAAELLRRGVDDVIVLESQQRVGGAIESRRSDGFLIERGPITVRGTADLEELAQRAGVELIHGRRMAPALVSGGALLPIPPRIGQLLRGRPLPLRAWLDVLAEPFRRHPSGPRTVREFVEQRLGPRVAERCADLLTLGIYGAPAERVGFEAAFPGLASGLDEHGSLARMLWKRARSSSERRPLVSTPQGLEALPAALARGLGPRLALGHGLESVEGRPEGFELALSGGERVRARRLVLALPPEQIARVCDSARDLARVARGYAHSPQTLASFALRDAGLAERFRHFGFLVPPREQLPLIGCLAPSAIFPGRAPEGCLLLTAFVAQPLVGAPHKELQEALCGALERLLESSSPPELLDVAHHPAGICLYDRRHTARTSILRARLQALGIDLAGASYDGVSVGDAAASGIRAARAVSPAAR